MIKPHERRQPPRVERTAEMLREQLEQEFVAIHWRRTLSRRIARASAVATLVCLASVGLWWNAGFWPGRANPADQLVQNGRHDGSSTNGSESLTPANSTPTYSAISVTDLSDKELRSLLAATKAQWFVAEIDGKPTAFPLEPRTRNKL